MYDLYTLDDPRDTTVRYVGMSQDAYQRYGMHLAFIGGTAKDAWIQELKDIGLFPVLEVIEKVETKTEALHREIHWIRHYLSLNAPLVNTLVPRIEVQSARLEEEEVAHFIVAQGWIPQVKARRNGIPYLYAAQRQGKKMKWRYISPVSRIGQLTEQKIMERLSQAT